MLNKYITNYFLAIFSTIPISLIIGPAVSLMNVVLIDISFIILIVFLRDFSFFKNQNFKYLIFLYFYLIFNSFISLDIELGLNRNVGFIRIIILFLAFNYFFKDKFFLNKILKIWLLIIFIVTLDIFIESFIGKNLIGYGGTYGERIVSFFKDEPIVGGYLNAFCLILIGFLFQFYGSTHKNKIFLISFIFLIAVILTGERSNSIKALIGLFLFYTVYSEFNLKKKIISLTLGLVLILSLIVSSDFLKVRFVDQIKSFKATDKYFKLYRSGFEVFKKHPIFGVGNKNYRFETCKYYHDRSNEEKKYYYCQTHPHQIYFELLSEHGLIGSLIFIYIIYKLIFSKVRHVLAQKNYIQLGSLIYMSLTFLPILPTGAFFSDFMITIFAINLSIFYAVGLKMNVFTVDNKN